MISIEGGHFVPIPFKSLLDAETGRTKVRMVDIHSTRYAIARRYMIRLRRDDFQDPHEVARLAATCRLTPEESRAEFDYLVEDEPPALVLESFADAVEPSATPRRRARPVRRRRQAR